ncbi:MAG: XRE family transcriptional regulator [Candidatus Binatia bacterium]
MPISVSPNPEREQLNAHLTLQIYRIIKSRGLTQAEAGAILGISSPAFRP